jgi:hypothetical protein
VPFDDTNYREPQMEPLRRRPPSLTRRDEAILLAAIFLGLGVALLLPISAGSLADLAAAIAGRRG